MVQHSFYGATTINLISKSEQLYKCPKHSSYTQDFKSLSALVLNKYKFVVINLSAYLYLAFYKLSRTEHFESRYEEKTISCLLMCTHFQFVAEKFDKSLFMLVAQLLSKLFVFFEIGVIPSVVENKDIWS